MMPAENYIILKKLVKSLEKEAIGWIPFKHSCKEKYRSLCWFRGLRVEFRQCEWEADTSNTACWSRLQKM